MTQQPPSSRPARPSPQPNPTPQANSISQAAPAAEERPRLLSGLSPAQIIGGALAAATAAALGARLGVAGTVIGAAFASLIAAIGGKLYSETLRRTHHGLSGAISRQGRVTTVTDEVVTETLRTGEASVLDAVVPGGRRRFGTSAVALTALASFALAAVAVTMIETGTGRSLDGSTMTTASRVITQTTRVPVKAGGPPTATASQAAGYGQPKGDGESNRGPASAPPSSLPKDPQASDKPRPDASAPVDPEPDTRPPPAGAPSADPVPSAAQPSAPATQAPSSGGSQP